MEFLFFLKFKNLWNFRSSDIYFIRTNCTRFYLFPPAPQHLRPPQPAACRLPAVLLNKISTSSHLWTTSLIATCSNKGVIVAGTHADRASDGRGRPANGAVGGGVRDDARAGGEKRGGRCVEDAGAQLNPGPRYLRVRSLFGETKRAHVSVLLRQDIASCGPQRYSVQDRRRSTHICRQMSQLLPVITAVQR